uniref:Uncharacterized protein n=1 Tax=Romanomermis culicivorax TaxID=13658 RepID=A0A915KDA7_ROMCU
MKWYENVNNEESSHIVVPISPGRQDTLKTANFDKKKPSDFENFVTPDHTWAMPGYLSHRVSTFLGSVATLAVVGILRTAFGRHILYK